MNKKWIINKNDIEKSTKLSKELKIPETLGKLLVQRGIETFGEAKHFFRPELSDLHDPFLMKGMDEAVERILTALELGEKILIYGDYDVDGTCSVAMVYHFFSQLTKDLEYYIPDRYAEGYGLSDKGVDYAIENGFSLVITLDCGIKSKDKVERAKKSKVDFIICDHHLPGPSLPPAVAILDPKQKGCSYPYKELCGCGVGFKLLQALAGKLSIDDAIIYSYLDLVSLAIAADIVPIDGENRIMCFYGLKQVNKDPRIGIKTLLALKEKSKYLVGDLVFTLAPRINAAGRIRSGKFAVSLLIEEDSETAKAFAKEIEADNNYRRELDKEITIQALNQIEEYEDFMERKSTVVYDENWHKGVVGIVASRMIEKYFRPTIVLTRSGDIASGSARSVPGFDLYQALDKCSDHLIQFGGHKYAAGMTLEIEKIHEFRNAFEEVVSETIQADQLIPNVKIDLAIDLDQISNKLFRIVQQMEPFGPGNHEPIFMTKGVYDKGKTKVVGADQLHLKLEITQTGKESINAIAFNFGHLHNRIKSGEKFNIAYHVQENAWNGFTSLQLMVKDIQF